MNSTLKASLGKLLRRRRVRTRVIGTPERPRLSVHVSNRHMNAQVIDDTKHATLLSVTTVANKTATGTMSEKAGAIGAELGKKAKKAGVTKVVFDRGARGYARRLSAFADAARKEGLEF